MGENNQTIDTNQIAQLWQRIEEWLTIHAPETATGLYSGASHDEIAEAEEEFGITFPEDFRASYLIHNGQPRNHRLFDGWSLRSLESMLNNWRNYKTNFDLGTYRSFPTHKNNRIRAKWWLPGWISFTDSLTGSGHCLDFVPTKKGTVGQIFRFWNDSPDRIWLAANFTTFFTQFSDDLLAGKYQYAGNGRLELVDDP